MLFAKAQCESCDVCFTFKVHTLIQEKNKKRKERLHTPVNILYELFLARGNFFAKVCESCDVCFTFKVHTLIQEKTKKEKKKRKERLHTPVNILYELFLARENFFAKVNDP